MHSIIRRPTLNIVHHSLFLALCLGLNDHPLQDCPFDRTMIRSETMAERALLLPQAHQTGHDPPIFVRVCHSPWPFLNQRSLALVRTILALYSAVILAFSVGREWKDPTRGNLLFFDARILSFAVQTMYYWITMVCVSRQHCRP